MLKESGHLSWEAELFPLPQEVGEFCSSQETFHTPMGGGANLELLETRNAKSLQIWCYVTRLYLLISTQNENHLVFK